MLGPRRKNWSNRFPSQQHGSGDDRILEEKTKSEKHGAVAEASESRCQHIGAQLAETWPVKDIRSAFGTKARVDKAEAGNHGSLEERDGNNRACEKFSNHQDFFSYRNQELIVKSALDHFAAEEPGKNTHAGEEDAQAEIINLNNTGEDKRIVFD